MQKELIESIVTDKKTIKFGEWNRQYFIFESDSLVLDSFLCIGDIPQIILPSLIEE